MLAGGQERQWSTIGSTFCPQRASGELASSFLPASLAEPFEDVVDTLSVPVVPRQRAFDNCEGAIAYLQLGKWHLCLFYEAKLTEPCDHIT